MERIGYQVFGFTNPEQALEFFIQDPYKFDIVVTDATMPKMPGDILGKKILELRDDLPIIVCSGYTERMNSEQVIEKGFSEFVTKPISFIRLARIVQHVLKRKEGKLVQ